MKNALSVVIAVLLVGLLACQPEAPIETDVVKVAKLQLPAEPFNYADVQLPADFDQGLLQLLDNSNNDNPVTDAGATLGRVLFYDTRLSVDSTVSCASCHLQKHAFSDPERFSKGIHGQLTPRNSMPLFNLRYSRRLFWDSRTPTIEQQVLLPIQDATEMGLSLELLVERLQEIPDYPPLFEAAFGTATPTTDLVARALAQFLRSIYSYQSRYDAGLKNEFADFTAEELLGKELFFGGETGCNFCHGLITFTTFTAFNNGLDVEYTDQGLGAVTGNIEDNGKFKTPTLRNIALTAPYMHDGRFETLEEVLHHYNEGVAHHPNLDDRMSTDLMTGGPPKQLNLSQADQQAIIAFLKTLTDEQLLTDERFSNPFVYQ